MYRVGAPDRFEFVYCRGLHNPAILFHNYFMALFVARRIKAPRIKPEIQAFTAVLTPEHPQREATIPAERLPNCAGRSAPNAAGTPQRS